MALNVVSNAGPLMAFSKLNILKGNSYTIKFVKMSL
jgi:hypothetical protein